MIVSFCQNLLGGNECPLVYCVNLMILFSLTGVKGEEINRILANNL